jgi:hypothetical protein
MLVMGLKEKCLSCPFIDLLASIMYICVLVFEVWRKHICFTFVGVCYKIKTYVF